MSLSQSSASVSQVANVLIVYTGGTIGMKQTSTGLQPVKGYLAGHLAKLPQFHDCEQPELTTPVSRFGKRIHYEIMEWDELLDSSNINQEHWVKMINDIEKNYDKYDAFIIMHGTDTMAYTASALSFMIENLGKTIILTGSQVPFAQEPNDAAHNLLMSLTIAGHFEIPEVCIYFDHKLLRGNRCRKIDALGFDAFNSLNLPELVKVGTELDVNWNIIRAPPRDESTIFHKDFNPNVGVLKLFPGVSDITVRNFLQPPLQGCVIETYGTGNAPSNRPGFLAALKDAIDRGVVVVNVSQCLKGMVHHGVYATSSSLASIGVLSGHDMTPEAALAKLSYLLANKELKPHRVKELIGVSLRGELTSGSPVRFSFKDETFLRSVAKALMAETGSSANGGIVIGEQGQIHSAGLDPQNPSSELKHALFPVLMCSAAHIGIVDNLRCLIKSGANPNCYDYDNRTPLHIAAGEGHLKAVKFLILEAGANIHALDRWGSSALDEAIHHDHSDVVAFLKLQGAVECATSYRTPTTSRVTPSNTTNNNMYGNPNV